MKGQCIIQYMKHCAKCKEIKPHYDFHKNSKRPCGHSGYCKQCAKEYAKQKYMEKDPQEKEIQNRIKYQQNPEKYKEYTKRYYYENKDKIREKNRNPQERRKNQARQEIITLLKKPKSKSKYIGCDGFFLKSYLESMFKEGMSWDRRKEIHIDHIIPFKMFDLTNEEERKKCCHYTNLQPLWAKENMEKAAKILPEKGDGTFS